MFFTKTANNTLRSITARRIKRLLLVEQSSIVALLGMTGFFLGLGFLLTTGNNPNYKLIEQFMPYIMWGALFTSYGITKVSQSIYRVPFRVKLLSSLIGMWAWAYVFLSFTIFDTSPVAPTEILLCIPLVCELWVTTTAFYNKSEALDRRKEEKQFLERRNYDSKF